MNIRGLATSPLMLEPTNLKQRAVFRAQVMKQVNENLNSAVFRLLRPLARILLRYNISFLTFSNLAKQVFVDVAKKFPPPPGRKQSLSRIAMLTGLSRKEVLRVKRLPISADGETLAHQGCSIRVINGWTHDHRFLDDSGNPLVLDLDGQDTTLTVKPATSFM